MGSNPTKIFHKFSVKIYLYDHLAEAIVLFMSVRCTKHKLSRSQIPSDKSWKRHSLKSIMSIILWCLLKIMASVLTCLQSNFSDALKTLKVQETLLSKSNSSQSFPLWPGKNRSYAYLHNLYIDGSTNQITFGLWLHWALNVNLTGLVKSSNEDCSRVILTVCLPTRA